MPVRDDSSIFRWALLISLLLHVLVLFLVVPGLSKIWTRAFAATPPTHEKINQKPPLEFEFVDLPEDQAEDPGKAETAPLSDKNRRAHGGEGDPSPKPSSQGNTPQIVQAEGGQELSSGAPPQLPQPRRKKVPPARKQAPSPNQRVQEFKKQEVEGLGKEQEDSRKPQQPRQPRITLPPAGSFALPPGLGGIRENPDRGGGIVDSGGLSFDTQWYDWGPYAKLMLAKIRRNWRIPEIAQLGVAGRVRIRFFIEADGSVSSLRITDESGKPPMDNSARNAISHSSPFNPLPPDLSGVEREGVTITFFYNSRPPERGQH